jgi:hypothetical protein
MKTELSTAARQNMMTGLLRMQKAFVKNGRLSRPQLEEFLEITRMAESAGFLPAEKAQLIKANLQGLLA